MSDFIVNGRVYPSIWKTKDTAAETETKNSTSQAQRRQAYRDPTADAAICNIMREERNKNRKKRSKPKHIKCR